MQESVSRNSWLLSSLLLKGRASVKKTVKVYRVFHSVGWVGAKTFLRCYVPQVEEKWTNCVAEKDVVWIIYAASGHIGTPSLKCFINLKRPTCFIICVSYGVDQLSCPVKPLPPIPFCCHLVLMTSHSMHSTYCGLNERPWQGAPGVARRCSTHFSHLIIAGHHLSTLRLVCFGAHRHV